MHFDLPTLEEYVDQFRDETAHHDKERNPEIMSVLTEYFGHPERVCPCFHVAGSKGKGTIANSIAAILREKGFSTGVFSSPHVYHFTERISTGDGAFPIEIYQKAEKELRAGIGHLLEKGALKKEDLVWSILLTTYAMLVFRAADVDYAIYEVGVGGRVDATNIIYPLAIAIGPVELEHTRLLGTTLGEIAAEKAGIFKANTPIFSAPQPVEVQSVFEAQAARKQSWITYVPDNDNYKILDAHIAFEAVRQIIPDLDEDTAESAALQVSLPARYEYHASYKGLPYLLMDGAHTENSVKKVLTRMEDDGVHGNLIFACAADKSVEKMAKAIIRSELFDTIYLTRPGDYKKADFPRMQKAFENTSVKVVANENPQALIKQAIEDSRGTHTPLITLGSLYLPPEVKKIS